MNGVCRLVGALAVQWFSIDQDRIYFRGRTRHFDFPSWISECFTELYRLDSTDLFVWYGIKSSGCLDVFWIYLVFWIYRWIWSCFSHNHTHISPGIYSLHCLIFFNLTVSITPCISSCISYIYRWYVCNDFVSYKGTREGMARFSGVMQFRPP